MTNRCLNSLLLSICEQPFTSTTIHFNKVDQKISSDELVTKKCRLMPAQTEFKAVLGALPCSRTADGGVSDDFDVLLNHFHEFVGPKGTAGARLRASDRLFVCLFGCLLLLFVLVLLLFVCLYVSRHRAALRRAPHRRTTTTPITDYHGIW